MTLRYVIALVLLLFASTAYAGTRIVVEGHGVTLDLAKQNAFRNAIEQVVGQVIVSDQEVQGDRLTKDWIGGYSAGYVDDYEILETRQQNSLIVVKMNVAVSSSKIAKRMLSSGYKSLIVEGQRLQAQMDTQLDQRDRGDQLIADVLSSYPYHAYVINSGQTQPSTELGIDEQRRVFINVPYEIHWSRFWIEGVDEAVKAVAVDSKNCNSFWAKQDSELNPNRDSLCGQDADLRLTYKNKEDWFSQTHSYYFYDSRTLEVINTVLQNPTGRQHVGLKVDLLDANGDALDSRCHKLDISPFITYIEPKFKVIHWNQRQKILHPIINGQASVYGILRVYLRSHNKLDDIVKINLTIEKTCG